MRPFLNCLVLAALLAGCDAATNALDPVNSDPSAPAFTAAGALVDPNTLIPVPPPGAICRADGNGTICHTAVSLAPVNEPVLDLPCGTVYETSTDVRHGIRWYNTDNKIVRRFVTQDVEGTWSLSPEGEGPTATITAHDNWTNLYTVPGDDTSGEQPTHGDLLTVQSSGFGVIAHIAGLNPDAPDGAGHGIVRGVDDPAAASELCAALTR